MACNPRMKSKLIISRVINTTMIALAIFSCFLQIFIDDSTDNIASSCIALIGSLSALVYLRNTDGFETHPVSTFAIFGFCATTQLGALLVQSATFISLSNGLRQPIMTFSVLAFYQVIAIAAHLTYCYFSTSGTQDREEYSVRRVLEFVGMYSIPTAGQLWILGFIGLIAIFMSGGGSTQDVSNKVSVGISYLAWSPFLIPIFFAQLGGQYCDAKKNYFFLTLFASFLGLIGIAANARYMIVSGVTTISFVTLLIGMRSMSVVTTKQISKMIVILGVCVAMLVPLSQLATAMIVVRTTNKQTNAANVVSATIDVLKRPELIEAQRRKDKLAALISPYDEIYVENPLLARFVLTKYHDNALFFQARLTSRAEDELGETTIDQFWSILPDPVLKFFDIAIVKSRLKFSMGDYLYYQATGGALGGFKIGSIFGHGIALFGWYFSIIYFIMCLLSFWILDLLANRDKKGNVVISVVGMLVIWRLYLYGITAESVYGTFGFLFREIPQSILLFVILFQATRLFTAVFAMVERLRQPVIMAKNEAQMQNLKNDVLQIN